MSGKEVLRRGWPVPLRGRSGDDTPSYRPADLRQIALEQTGHRCTWPGMDHEGPLEMAHLEHRGMGGSAAANRPDKVTILCRYHHGVLDGRTVHGRRAAVVGLLTAYLASEQQ